MCLPVICLRLFILISTSQCNIKQIALADRFAMLAVFRLRSDTFGSTITAQAARQDSAEFKILAMRSWRENESPWSEFVQLFAEVSDIFRIQTYSDYISTIIFRDTAPGRLLQMNFVKTFGHSKVALSSKFGLGYCLHTFFPHILTPMISCFLNLFIDGLANSQYLLSKSIQNIKPCGLCRWF